MKASSFVAILASRSSATILDTHDQMLTAMFDVNQDQIRKLFDSICQQLSAPLKKSVYIAGKTGASSWLSALALQKHGYMHYINRLCDDISFWYN